MLCRRCLVMKRQHFSGFILFALVVFVVYHLVLRDRRQQMLEFTERQVDYYANFVRTVGKCRVYEGPSVEELERDDFPAPRVTSLAGQHQLIIPYNSLVPTVKLYTYGLWDFISKEIAVWGSFERQQMEQVALLFHNHPELNMVDIGANLGLYSFIGAAFNRSVVAVDANLHNIIRMSETAVANRFARRRPSSPPQGGHWVPSRSSNRQPFTVVWNAVGNQKGPLTLKLNLNNMGGSSVSWNGRSSPNSFHIKTDVIYMDHLLTVINFDNIIMKIDIENSEYFALQMANKFFNNRHVPIVLFEWKDKMFNPKVRVNFYINFFESRDYLVCGKNKTGGIAKLSYSQYFTWPNDVFFVKGQKYLDTLMSIIS